MLRRHPLVRRHVATLFALGLGTLLVQSALASNASRGTTSGSTRVLAATTTPTGLRAGADTYVDSTRPSESFGAESNLSVSSPKTKYAYLRFDVVGLTSAVTRATLHVYSTAASPGALEIWGTTGSWGETTTWKNRPALGANSLMTFSTGASNTWSAVDVTSLVRGNGALNLALIAPKGRKLVTLGSRESGAGAVLTVQTATSTPPPTSTDTQPPSAPGSLAAGAQTGTSMDLNWTPSSDNVAVAGYGVYLGGILAANSSNTHHAFSGLTCGTTYTLGVDAYDAKGNRSIRTSLNASTSACVVPVSPPPPTSTDTQPPSAPGSLAAGAQTGTSMDLNWTPSSDNVAVAGYGVYLGGILAANSSNTHHAFSGLTCGTTYTLGVDAYDAKGNRSIRTSLNASTSACVVQAPPTSGIAPTAPRLFGFSNGNRKSSADEFRQAVGIGASLLRVDAQWAWMEPSRGSYDWSSWDAVVANAKATGGKLIACIAYTPSWARPAGTTMFQEPNDANEADYARFAGAFAARYASSGVLVGVEIWNEPNLSSFWKPKPNPAKYTRLIRSAYQAVKAAAPSLEVITAGLSPAGSYSSHPLGGADVNPVRYLEAIYANGGQGHFDAVGHHPYDFNGAPATTNQASAWYQMFGTNPSLRSLMERNGDGAKRIHATEFGIPSQLSTFGVTFSEEKQRQMMDASVRAWKTFSWAGHFAAYLQKDGINGGEGTWFYHYGLQKVDGTPKPAWWAFRDAIR